MIILVSWAWLRGVPRRVAVILANLDDLGEAWALLDNNVVRGDEREARLRVTRGDDNAPFEFAEAVGGEALNLSALDWLELRERKVAKAPDHLFLAGEVLALVGGELEGEEERDELGIDPEEDESSLEEVDKSRGAELDPERVVGGLKVAGAASPRAVVFPETPSKSA